MTASPFGPPPPPPMLELYQELILDHAKHPRNKRTMEDADQHAEGFNPLCGDRVIVYLKLDQEALRDVSFQGAACAICTASASLMTQHVKGLSREQALGAFSAFHHMLTKEDGTPPPGFEKLAALATVRKYPMRVKCATLPWHTMKAALDAEAEPVSTEA